MKKILYTFFIFSASLCGIIGILSVYLFASNVSVAGAFGIFSLCLAVGVITSFICHKTITKELKSYSSNTVRKFQRGEYESDPQFGYRNEFEPFISLIDAQNRLIKAHIKKLKAERNTIKAITDNMKEGFILFNSSFEILTFNKSATVFLHSQNVVFENDRLITLTENSPLHDAVKKALEGAANDFTVEIASKTFQIFANPVTHDVGIYGVVVMCVDITQKKNIEKSNRDFTVNVSHELKTPLTSISGYAEMLANGMVSDTDDIKKFAGIIYKETSRLVKLTSDIVRLSEIESNMLPANDEEIEIRTLFDSTIETLTLTADKNDVTLVNLLNTQITFIANRSLIEELVFNLCENAVKYNKPGGTVTLSADKKLNGIEIIVADTGIGIPENRLENIFNRFWRADKSRSKSTGGTGLGLSIVKQITEYYSGTVYAESELGKGTVITVKLYPEINL